MSDNLNERRPETWDEFIKAQNRQKRRVTKKDCSHRIHVYTTGSHWEIDLLIPDPEVITTPELLKESTLLLIEGISPITGKHVVQAVPRAAVSYVRIYPFTDSDTDSEASTNA